MGENSQFFFHNYLLMTILFVMTILSMLTIQMGVHGVRTRRVGIARFVVIDPIVPLVQAGPLTRIGLPRSIGVHVVALNKAGGGQMFGRTIGYPTIGWVRFGFGWRYRFDTIFDGMVIGTIGIEFVGVVGGVLRL